MSDDITQFAAHDRRMRVGLANVTLNWSWVENHLVALLSVIIGEKSPVISSAIYFSANSLDSRMAMVDAAFKMFLMLRPEGEILSPHWTTTLNALKRLKATRNKIAHGQIISLHQNGKHHARLTSPIFDIGRLGREMRSGQMPGLSANDVENAAQAVLDLLPKLEAFAATVSAMVGGDEPALRQRLDALAALFPTPDHPQDNQTQPEPSPQPQSSGE